jgi:STAM-binding protein
LNHITRHPDAAVQSNRQALVQAQREANKSLSKLEVLKPRIQQHCQRYAQVLRDREKARRIEVSPPESGSVAAIEFLDPALAGRAQTLTAADNKDLAVKLAQKELRRRATARHVPAGDDGYSRGGTVEKPQYGRTRFDQATDEDDLSRRLQEVRNRVAGQQQQQAKTAEPLQAGNSIRSGQRKIGTDYHYPLVPQKSDYDGHRSPPPVPGKEPNFLRSISPPTLPPQVPEKTPEAPPLWDFSYAQQQLEQPPLPRKVPLISGMPESNTSTISRGTTPASDLHPSDFTFKPSSYLENGTPLRTIFISPDLRKQFLHIAGPNTRRNLETCGMLCATLMSNAFFISKLVIPEQESTSDTCEMINESGFFDYCDSEDLMVLGWIHTHPTQTCFMSSRDLHTHAGYQAMLAESIAIVCAPSKTPDWGVFRLTDPPGLKTVLACNQSGLFHPHAESNIYTDALRPGHVFEAPGLEFETVDLRVGARS